MLNGMVDRRDRTLCQNSTTHNCNNNKFVGNKFHGNSEKKINKYLDRTKEEKNQYLLMRCCLMTF